MPILADARPEFTAQCDGWVCALDMKGNQALEKPLNTEGKGRNFKKTWER